MQIVFCVMSYLDINTDRVIDNDPQPKQHSRIICSSLPQKRKVWLRCNIDELI